MYVGIDANDIKNIGEKAGGLMSYTTGLVSRFFRNPRTHIGILNTVTGMAGGAIGAAVAGPVGAGLVTLGIGIGGINATISVLYGMKVAKDLKEKERFHESLTEYPLEEPAVVVM